MNQLEMALLKPLVEYLLSELEKKYGDRIVQLENQIAQLLSNHSVDAVKPSAE